MNTIYSLNIYNNHPIVKEMNFGPVFNELDRFKMERVFSNAFKSLVAVLLQNHPTNF